MVDEEWDVIPDPAEEAEGAPSPVAVGHDDGSSPKMLWEGLLGLVVGLLSLPLIVDGFMHLIIPLVGHGIPIPFWLWAGALVVTLLIEVGIGLWLRRVSDMCAVTFAIAAFFSILETVGMMTEMSPLMLPKLSGP